MTISNGNLDSLLGMTLDPQALAALNFSAGSASGGKVSSVTGTTGTAPYGGANSLQVTSVNDAANTIVVTATVAANSGYGYGGGSTTVPYYFTVIGTSGADILLAAQGAAAMHSLPASTVANDIQTGNTGALNGDLFVMTTNGTKIGATVTPVQTLTFSGLIPISESVAQSLASPSTGAVIIDSAAMVQANLDALQTQAASGNIASITLNDSGIPGIFLTQGQLSADATLLGKIGGSFNLAVTGVTAAAAATDAAQAHVTTLAISDSGANVLANVSALNTLLTNGKTLSIALTDSGIPTLSLSAAAFASDTAVLKTIGTNFNAGIDGTVANISVTGLSGRATLVNFGANAASSYTVTPSGDGVSFTLTGNGSTDHFNGITALQFSGGIDFVAPTPGTGGAINGGNVTELYAAALGRTPDVPGLAYYQNLIANNPGFGLVNLAHDFIASPEYVNNPAHAYAQTSAGDAQFITDTYNNLLHRPPETGAVAFYQGIINQLLAGLTAGTAAFTAAELLGHTMILVDFSASAEFVGDTQITAAHPADSQHWLYLI